MPSDIEYRFDDPELGEVTFKAKILPDRLQARLYLFGLKKMWSISSILEREDFYEIVITPFKDKITLCEVAYIESWIEGDSLYMTLALLTSIKPIILINFLEWIKDVSRRKFNISISTIKLLTVTGHVPHEELEKAGYRKTNGYYIKVL